jgi:predicted nucleotidyltransferase
MVPESIRTLLDEKGLQLALLVRSGSKAYGIDVAGSDDDYLGVFVPSLRRFVSLGGIERDSHAGNGPDYTLHEIGKFSALALKGNPAILETLWNPEIVAADEWGRSLIALREKCLHRGSLKVYVAYAEAQLKKMLAGKAVHAKGGAYNGKFGMHLVRVLHAGLRLARTGQVMVRVPADLAKLLDRIRSTELSQEGVSGMARALLHDLQRLSADNPLPDEPDRAAFDDLVIRARMSRT